MKKTTSKEETKEEKDPKKPPLNNYLKYSSLGFQMLASIVGGLLLGMFLDERYRQPDEFQLYTVLGALAGVFLALYLPLKELLGKDDQ